MEQGDSSEKRRHVAIAVTRDAWSFRWGAVTRLPTRTISVGEYWDGDIRGEHINIKEMWAVFKGLTSLPEIVSDRKMNMQVDSIVVFHAWSGRCMATL